MATDAEIRAAGLYAVPKNKYLQNEFQLPTNEVVEEETESFGIPNTNAFTNSGGNDFNSAGNAFGYGSPVNEVNVRTFNPQSNDPTGSVASAQEAYNQFEDIKDKSIYPNYDDINNQIMDNRQNYQSNYKSPYDDTVDLGYLGRDTSTSLEGRIGKDGIRRRSGLGKAIDFVTDFIPVVGPVKKGIKFVSGLLPDNPNGPGGGTYGIGGLSDDKKAAYNALAKNSMLFDGQQGFKTSTGKNFQAKDYVPNQIEIYNQMTEQGYKLDEDGNVIDPKTNKVIGKNKNYTKRKFLEASTMYKTTQKQNKDAADAAAQAAVRETNFASQGKSDPNDQSRKGSLGRRPGSGGNVTATAANTNKETGTTYDSGGKEGFGYGLKDGGRAGYFFGGRVNYKAGGRIGFAGGGMDMGNEENQAQSAAIGAGTSTPGPGDTGGEGGNNPSDDSDTQFGDGNNNNNDNNERTTFFQKIKNNRIINNPLTRLIGRVGMYSVNPSLMGKNFRTASQLKGVYDKATDDVDEDDVTLNEIQTRWKNRFCRRWNGHG